MNRDEIVQTVNTALAQEFELDETKLTPDADLHEDLSLDSLDRVDMAIVLEKAFHFRVEDKSKLAHIRTMGDIYDLIEKERAKQM